MGVLSKKKGIGGEFLLVVFVADCARRGRGKGTGSAKGEKSEGEEGARLDAVPIHRWTRESNNNEKEE